MKTYIFSNCAKNDVETYGKNLLAKVPLDSKLILLNKGNVYYKVKEFKEYKDQNFIMRSCGTHGLYSFFGMQDILGAAHRINDIIFFQPHTKDARILIGHKDESVDEKVIDIPWMEEYTKATNGNFATTGYSAYYLVQQIYGVKPEDIVLVNFYGNADNSTYKDGTHNWSYEDKWIQDKTRIFL